MSTFVIFIDLPHHFMGCTFAQRQVSKIGNFFQVWNLFFWRDQNPMATLANTAVRNRSFITFIWIHLGQSWITTHFICKPNSWTYKMHKRVCTLKEPFETMPSHQKPCLNHAEKRHIPMYIHTIPYQSIQVQTKISVEFYNLPNPDSLQFWGFPELILNTMTAKRLQRTGLNGLRCCHKGIRTEAEDLGKICGKSAFFDGQFQVLMAKLHFVWRENRTFW